MLWLHALLGAGILSSYIVVIGDAFGRFPINSVSYFDSAWWVNLPPDSAKALTLLQLVAAASSVYWYQWAFALESGSWIPKLRVPLTTTLLAASFVWPYIAYFALKFRSLSSAILACVPLWIVAIVSIAFLAFTFEARASPLPVLASIGASCVFVLVDGIGWSASLIYDRLYN